MSTVNFNLGFLRAIQSSIYEALDSVESKCVNYLNVRNMSDFDADLYLHKVQGAVKMIGLNGLSTIFESAENLVLEMKRENVVSIEECMNSLIELCKATRLYIEDLLSGNKDLPIKLYNNYKRIKLAESVSSVFSESDLFYPSLDIDLDIDFEGYDRSTLQYKLTPLKNKFDLSLKDNKAGVDGSLDNIKSALNSIANLKDKKGFYLFFKVCVAFIDLIKEEPTNAVLLGVLNKIEIEIKKYYDGIKKPSEDLLKVMLFTIANSEVLSVDINEVKELFDIERYFSEFKEQSLIDEAHLLDININEYKEMIVKLENEWSKALDENSFMKIYSLINLFYHKVDVFKNQALTKLCETLVFTSKKLSNGNLKINDQVAEEVAVILLFIDSIIDKRGRSNQEFNSQVVVQIKRLLLAIEGKKEELKTLPIAQLDSKSKHEQDVQLISHTVNELKKDLGTITEKLDYFIRYNGENREEIDELEKPCKNIAGTLRVLNLIPAAKIFIKIAKVIKNLTTPNYQLNKEETDIIANGIGILELYLDYYQNGNENAEDLLSDLYKELYNEDMPRSEKQAKPAFKANSLLKDATVDNILENALEVSDKVVDIQSVVEVETVEEKAIEADSIELVTESLELVKDVEDEHVNLVTEEPVVLELVDNVENNHVDLLTESPVVLELVDNVENNHVDLATDNSTLELVDSFAEPVVESSLLEQVNVISTGKEKKMVEIQKTITVEKVVMEKVEQVKTIEVEDFVDIETKEIVRKPIDLNSEEYSQSVGVLDESADEELLEVYLEETEGIFSEIAESIINCKSNRADKESLNNIRRQFHTLKGSGKMVLLMNLAEAAWLIEDHLNRWLSENKEADDNLIELIESSTELFKLWVEDLKNNEKALVNDKIIRKKIELCNNPDLSYETVEVVTVVKQPIMKTVEVVEIVEVPKTITEEVLVTEMVEVEVDSPVEEVVSDVVENNTLINDFEVDYVLIGDVKVDKGLFAIFTSETKERLESLHACINNLKQSDTKLISEDFVIATHTLGSIGRSVALSVISELAYDLEQWSVKAFDSHAVLTEKDIEDAEVVVNKIDNLIVNATEKGELPDNISTYLDLISEMKLRLNDSITIVNIEESEIDLVEELIEELDEEEELESILNMVNEEEDDNYIVEEKDVDITNNIVNVSSEENNEVLAVDIEVNEEVLEVVNIEPVLENTVVEVLTVNDENLVANIEVETQITENNEVSNMLYEVAKEFNNLQASLNNIESIVLRIADVLKDKKKR